MCLQKAAISTLVALLISGNLLADCGGEASISEIHKSEKETLSGPFSVAELERDRMIEIRETGETLPFGYSNSEWEQLKSLMQPGDQIFHVLHQDGRYSHSGHLLIREGCVVFFLLGSIT